MPGTSRWRLQFAATIVAGLSAAVLVLFLVGETVGGDLSGLQHLVQLAPLVALIALGWRAPRLAGWLLIVIGALIAGAYLWMAEGTNAGAVERALVGGLFLLPPVIGGALFVAASRRT